MRQVKISFYGMIIVFNVNQAVHAAVPSLPYDRPGDKELTVPFVEPERKQKPGFQLPAIPPDIRQINPDLVFNLRNIHFSGNTVFSDDELLEVVSQYLNTWVGSKDLQQIRINISKYYIDHGYINSGALLPDQRIEDGVVTFRIIEGQLSAIQLSGNDKLHHNYIYERIIDGVEKPLNVNDLQKSLLLLQQDERLDRINARLQPATERGRSVLYVDVQEADQIKAYLTLNNHRPPSVGSEYGIIELKHINLTGRGDTMAFQFGSTKGLNDYSVFYDYPVTSKDSKVSVFYENSDSEVIEEPFSTLDVMSRATTVGLGFSQQLIREVNSQLIMGVNLEKRKSETLLLGSPFSFEAGPHDGVSRVSVWRFFVSWYERKNSSVLAMRASMNFGFDAFDATINDVDNPATTMDDESQYPDSKFQSLLLQAQSLNRFVSNDSRLLARGTVQLTDDPLLPLEQISVGGANSVRGYRENQLVGDSGLYATVEYRYPLVKNMQGGHLQIVAFSDYGRVWNKRRATPEFNSIYSVGTGVRWANKNGMEFELYWGEALRDARNPGNGIQDDGFHLRFKTELF